jgi:UDP-glucose 4-epimerase
LVGDSRKAREVLGWDPQFPELEKIIETAWAWHKENPNGYRPSDQAAAGRD